MDFNTNTVEELNPLPSLTKRHENVFEGFRLDWIEIANIEKVKLYTNLTDKKTTVQIISTGGCKYIISSGFYNKQGKHIGLFVSDRILLSSSIKDDFFDGYFYIKNNRAYLSLIEPSGTSLALQSGPVIMIENKFLDKSYPNDDFSRRILVGITRKGSVVFLVIYGDNKIMGPKLSEIKNIINDLESKTSVDLIDLINLDGGSHSAFITETISIPEVSTIGGYFCVEY